MKHRTLRCAAETLVLLLIAAFFGLGCLFVGIGRLL